MKLFKLYVALGIVFAAAVVSSSAQAAEGLGRATDPLEVPAGTFLCERLAASALKTGSAVVNVSEGKVSPVVHESTGSATTSM